MTILKLKSGTKEDICHLLKESNMALEEAIYKLKEAEESESDTRMWEARGDYRYGDYRHYPEDRRYRDDFRYRY